MTYCGSASRWQKVAAGRYVSHDGARFCAVRTGTSRWDLYDRSRRVARCISLAECQEIAANRRQSEAFRSKLSAFPAEPPEGKIKKPAQNGNMTERTKYGW